RPDLFVTGVRANHLFRNRGDGTFDELPFPQDGKWAVAAAWLDYDNDGLLDLFVVHYVEWDETRERYCGTAEYRQYCHPREYGPPISAMGAEFRDYDNDGREDLFVTALSNETFPLFRNKGNGSFEDVTLASGVAKASLRWTGWANVMADFNNDGWKDLFSANG